MFDILHHHKKEKSYEKNVFLFYFNLRINLSQKEGGFMPNDLRESCLEG